MPTEVFALHRQIGGIWFYIVIASAFLLDNLIQI